MNYYGALEAGGTKMVCAIGDETGKIQDRVSIPTRTPAETMPTMIEYFRERNISALGIGCFGPVNLNRGSSTYGYITSTPKLAWQNYNIVGTFREALGVKIGFDTDVNAAALGEATWGCTRDVENSLYITVGTGVGVGVIIGGKPYHGMMHPEGGHILLQRHPKDPMHGSSCPFHPNCLEGLASGPAVQKRWGARSTALSGRKDVWNLEAWYLGQAIADYILLLSPQRIVLGGGVMHQEGLLETVRQQVEKHLAGYLRTSEMENLDSYLVGVSLRDNQGVMGAVRLAMDAEKE